MKAADTSGQSLRHWLAMPGMPGRLEEVFRRAVRGSALTPEDVREAVFESALRQPGLTFLTEYDLLGWFSVAASHEVRRRERDLPGRRVHLVPDLPPVLEPAAEDEDPRPATGLLVLPALLLRTRPRRIAAAPVAAAAAAVVLHSAAGWLITPHRGETEASVHRTSAASSAAAPAWSPRDPEITRPGTTTSPSAAARTRGHQVTVSVTAPALGEVCAGTKTGPDQCGGDRLYLQPSDDVHSMTGGATEPLHGTGVSSEEVPLCHAPNTAVTRCDPDPAQ